MQQLDATAVGCLLTCCVLWGINQITIKLAIEQVAPLVQASLRSVIAAVLVVAWSLWRGVPLFERDGTLRGGTLTGLFFTATVACTFIGMQFTTAARFVVFLYLSPFVVALGMPAIERSERLSSAQMFGLVMAFAGVATAFAEGLMESVAAPRQWVGDALAVCAAAMWGGTALAVRASRLSHASAEKVLFYQLAVSAPLLALAAWSAGQRFDFQLSASLAGLIAYQAVVVSFGTLLLWAWLMRRYPAAKLASMTLLTPVFGLAAGVLLLGEPVTVRLLIALVTVCAGILLVNRRAAALSP